MSGIPWPAAALGSRRQPAGGRGLGCQRVSRGRGRRLLPSHVRSRLSVFARASGCLRRAVARSRSRSQRQVCLTTCSRRSRGTRRMKNYPPVSALLWSYGIRLLACLAAPGCPVCGPACYLRGSKQAKTSAGISPFSGSSRTAAALRRPGP